MGVPITVIWNVPHELPLGILIATYFYYTGLSAGSFVLSSLAYVFGIKKYKPIAPLAIVLATILLIMAPLHLIADLAQPHRFLHLMYMWNPRSMIFYGTIFLTLYPINCMIYGYFMMFTNKMKYIKLFGLLGVPLAICVHGYCGYILALVSARPLWHTALMPPLFLISAIVSGIALMIIILYIKGRFFSPEKKPDDEMIKGLGTLLLGTLLFDLFLMGVDVIKLVMTYAGGEAWEHAMLLFKGPLAFSFWGIEMMIGTIIPIFLLIIPKTAKSTRWVTFTALLVMIGIYSMRINWVVGGQLTPLS
jgi:tetrathionate reductase subunit C